MARFFTLAAVALVFMAEVGSPGLGADNPLPPFWVKMPIPDYPLPADFTAWSNSFTILKVSYDKDEGKVVLLLRTRRAMTFKDDGFFAPLRYYDKEGVKTVQGAKLKFDPDPRGLKSGEETRCYIIPASETVLKNTQMMRAVLHGQFTKER